MAGGRRAATEDLSRRHKGHETTVRNFGRQTHAGAGFVSLREEPWRDSRRTRIRPDPGNGPTFPQGGGEGTADAKLLAFFGPLSTIWQSSSGCSPFGESPHLLVQEFGSPPDSGDDS